MLSPRMKSSLKSGMWPKTKCIASAKPYSGQSTPQTAQYSSSLTLLSSNWRKTIIISRPGTNSATTLNPSTFLQAVTATWGRISWNRRQPKSARPIRIKPKTEMPTKKTRMTKTQPIQLAGGRRTLPCKRKRTTSKKYILAQTRSAQPRTQKGSWLNTRKNSLPRRRKMRPSRGFLRNQKQQDKCVSLILRVMFLRFIEYCRLFWL